MTISTKLKLKDVLSYDGRDIIDNLLKIVTECYYFLIVDSESLDQANGEYLKLHSDKFHSLIQLSTSCAHPRNSQSLINLQSLLANIAVADEVKNWLLTFSQGLCSDYEGFYETDNVLCGLKHLQKLYPNPTKVAGTVSVNLITAVMFSSLQEVGVNLNRTIEKLRNTIDKSFADRNYTLIRSSSPEMKGELSAIKFPCGLLCQFK